MIDIGQAITGIATAAVGYILAMESKDRKTAVKELKEEDKVLHKRVSDLDNKLQVAERDTLARIDDVKDELLLKLEANQKEMLLAVGASNKVLTDYMLKKG